MKTLLKMFLLAIVLALAIGEASGQYAWTKYAGNPVIQPGPPGSWDRADMHALAVLLRDTVYHLYYQAWDNSGDFLKYKRTGYARSTDGIRWTKRTSPVLDVGPSGVWDAWDAEGCAVLYDHGQYKMWYNGYSSAQWYQQIGYATGVNETTWTKRATPILSPGASGSWDDAGVMWACVLPASSGGGYRMWYSGFDGSSWGGDWVNYQTGYATATNETTWTKHPLNPVLPLGPPGSWDELRVVYGTVVYDSAAGLYYMFYSGTNKGRGTQDMQIGVATSSDGISWTKFSGNPVLSPGAAGTWDQSYLVAGGVVVVRDTFRLWYRGLDAARVSRIGYATSPRLPGKVVLISPGPIDEVGGDSVNFVWHKGTPSTTSYWFEYATNAQFSPSTVDSALSDTTVLVRGLSNGVTYWWRVRAKNTIGWGPYSFAPSFTTGIAEAEQVPSGFSLAQNYPNPFNPKTGVRFQVPGASDVRIAVYDLLGRELAVLVKERKAPGSYEVSFDGSDLASGMYVYRMTAGAFVQSRKMLLVK